MCSSTRRRVLESCGCAVGFALAGCVSGGGYECEEHATEHEQDVELDPAAAWPMFRYDAGNTGYNPNASIPDQKVEQYWRYTACSEVEAGVALSDGQVYAGSAILDSRNAERVTGAWGGYDRTPAVDEGTVFIGLHELRAVDVEDGSEQWTYEPDGESGGISAPTVHDETVYFGGNIDDPSLYAVNSDEGSRRFRFVPDGEIRSTPAVDSETVYTVCSDSIVYAIDTEQGEEQWSRELDGNLVGTPVVADETVFVSSTSGYVFALDATDGRQRWQRETTDGVAGPVAFADETVIAGQQDGQIIALNAHSGETRWDREVSQDSLSAPVVAADTILVGETDGSILYALDRQDGSERWTFETRSILFGDYDRQGISVAPAVVDEYIFLATEASDVYALGP